MSLEPGTRFGAYDVIARIGEGGMGEVYRARDRRLGRDVALKTLPGALAADPDRLARFEREARLLAALNHPNIATIHGIEDSGGIRAIVMELVEGETLDERIARGPGPLPIELVRSFARQIAEALDVAHERGIVHRDLKPANIKVTPDGLVKVLDFGLAKAVAAEGAATPRSDATTAMPEPTVEGAVLGTVRYMSPEQARGQSVDKRTDIWAFGCVLFEMLAGRPAFRRETSSDTLAAVLNADPDWAVLPGTVPPRLRRVIERCLTKPERERLRDIGDARHALEEAAETAVRREAALGAEAASPPVSRVSRRFVLTGGAAAVGLVGVGYAGGAMVARASRPVPTPSFDRLTFRRGLIRTARFAPDFQTVLYGALWDGDACRVYSVRPESPESAPINLPPAMPLAISASGELALALGTHLRGITTYGTLARVPLAGGAPRELAEDVKFADWSPDGQDLVVVRRVGERDQLEFPLGNVIAEPSTPAGGFSFPRVSPRGDRVACFELEVAGGLAGHVLVVDRTGARHLTSERFFNLFGLAWRGEEVWFTGADELPLFRNTVRAIAPDGRPRIVARIPGNASLHDIAPSGRLLMARTDDRSSIAVLTPGDSVERDLSWLDAPNIADISRDGGHILFTEGGVGGGPDASTYLRRTDGSAAVRLGDGRALALSPDARWALVRARPGPQLDLLPAGAGQARPIERAGLTFLGGRWLPDGRRLVVRASEGEAPAGLFALDLEQGAVTALTPRGVAVGAWWSPSPDGALIAALSPGGIDVYPIGGGPARRVADLTGSWRLHGWIHDGLLVSGTESLGEVIRVDPATGGRHAWRSITPRDPTGVMTMSTLAITPDGRAYAYSFHRALSDLYLVDGWT